MTLRIFSFGGGVQSNAALVLAARGEIDYPIFAFSNTGDDSENPDTLDYVRDYSIPYAAAHGIELVELQKDRRSGGTDTLLQMLMRRERSVDIPVRMNSGAPGRRQCTIRYKINVVGKFSKSRGATREDPARIGVGISIDEYHRMRNTSPIAWEVREYPLIDLGISRDDCKRIVAEAGLPVPPKSSCWFCPFKRNEEWLQMAIDKPDLFQQAVQLEETFNERRANLGRDPVWLSGTLKPLGELPLRAGSDEDIRTCDIGSCMT